MRQETTILLDPADLAKLHKRGLPLIVGEYRVLLVVEPPTTNGAEPTPARMTSSEVARNASLKRWAANPSITPAHRAKLRQNAAKGRAALAAKRRMTPARLAAARKSIVKARAALAAKLKKEATA